MFIVTWLLFLLLAVPALVLATATLLMVYEARAHGQAEAAKALGPLVGAWLAELGALIAVVLLRPFSWLPARKARSGEDQVPVALVHEFGCGRASMAMLAARLRRDGRDAVLVGYKHGSSDHSEITAQELAALLRRVAADAGSNQIDVIAHGFGGILIRTIARRYHGTELFARVVTLATPHAGTGLAQMFRGRAAVELRPGSGYLLRLADQDPLPGPIAMTNLVTTFDSFVFPSSSAYYDPALNVTLEGIGHFSLLFSEAAYELIHESLGHKASVTAVG